MYEEYQLGIPFTADNFPEKVPYLKYRKKDQYVSYDPKTGMEEKSIDQYVNVPNEPEQRPTVMLTFKYDIATLPFSQYYILTFQENAIVYRFFSIPIVYDFRKPLPKYTGFMETMRIYLTKEDGVLFERSQGIEPFLDTPAIRNRIKRYNIKRNELPEDRHTYDDIFFTMFPDFEWIDRMRFCITPYEGTCDDPDEYLRDLCLDIKSVFFNPIFAIDACMKLKRIQRSPSVDMSPFQYPDNSERYYRFAVLEVDEQNQCIVHYLTKLNFNTVHEYARNIFHPDGKEESYLHLCDGTWHKTRQYFYEYDKNVHLSDKMIKNGKVVRMNQASLRNTYLEHLCITKVENKYRLIYLYLAKRDVFWEQAVKCANKSWIRKQMIHLENCNIQRLTSFTRNKNFTDIFTIKEWKEHSKLIDILNIEQLCQIKQYGATIPVAHEILNNYHIWREYNSVEDKAKFVSLMTRLLKIKDDAFQEYKDYLYIRYGLPKSYRKKFPVVMPRKKIHRLHQNIVYVHQNYLLLKRKKELEEYDQKYQKLLKDADDHNLDLLMEDDEYAIFPAPTIMSLLDEGLFLHHCVGNYYRDVGHGETTIYYLRKKSNIQEPFYTVEVMRKDVRQVFTFYDSRIHEDSPEYKFLNKWIKKYKLKKLFMTYEERVKKDE